MRLIDDDENAVEDDIDESKNNNNNKADLYKCTSPWSHDTIVYNGNKSKVFGQGFGQGKKNDDDDLRE